MSVGPNRVRSEVKFLDDDEGRRRGGRPSERVKAENPEKGTAQGDATGGSCVGGYGYNLTKTGEQERKEGEGSMEAQTCSLPLFALA